MKKIVVVGGGIIGLSIAYEMATRGHRVTLLERDTFGQKASWAGGGMIPASNAETAIHPMEHLAALSHRLHVQWSEVLRERTGIDNGFRQCGGLYVARTPGEIAALIGVTSEWAELGIDFERLDDQEFGERFEAFAGLMDRSTRCQSVWVPGESQFSNPHHLKALVIACRQLGVSMCEGLGESVVETTRSAVVSVKANGKSYHGDQFFFTCGPWTQRLIEPTGVSLPMQPVRGQIALYRLDPTAHANIAMGPILYEGGRYLVPRRDGHVLAGSTIEEAGFDCRTTEPEINELRDWAENLTPAIDRSHYVKSWAGLRPATYDGFPYLGRLGGFGNAYVATGHFKSGLHLSTGTAVVMADLADGKPTSVDLRPLSPSRVVEGSVRDSRGAVNDAAQ